MNKILKASELINLSCPKGEFKFDENGMLLLTQKNFEIISDSYEKDQDLHSTYSGIEVYVEKSDYALDDYMKIIQSIAAINHTRTSQNACMEISELAVKHDLLSKIKNGETCIVDVMIEEMTIRKERSLLSKVCRYLETWKCDSKNFTINDSILRLVLPYYLYNYDNDEETRYEKMKDDVTFNEYLSNCNSLLRKCEIENLHELDYLLWYFYSKDSIRLEIIKYIKNETFKKL